LKQQKKKIKEIKKALNTCCIKFDGAVLRQQVRYDKVSETYTGLITEAEAVDRDEIISKVATHLTLVAIRSLPFTKFRMPVGIFFQKGSGKKAEIRAQLRGYLDVCNYPISFALFTFVI